MTNVTTYTAVITYTAEKRWARLRLARALLALYPNFSPQIVKINRIKAMIKLPYKKASQPIQPKDNHSGRSC